MRMDDYVEEIKLKLTGGVFELEIPDSTIAKVVNSALREVQRYIDTTRFITVPFSKCIDLKGFKFSSITQVYRAKGYMGDSDNIQGSFVDPMQAQYWMAASAGVSYNLNNFIMNLGGYNTFLQIRNTMSTDLSFVYDKQEEALYINTAGDNPQSVTIEYIPIFNNVEEITSDYWSDIILRLSLGLTKQLLGNIRRRYKQSNALWTQDGDEMAAEGTSEIESIREQLNTNSVLFYPVD